MKKTNFTKSNTKTIDYSEANLKSTRKKMDALEKKKIIASLTLMDDLKRVSYDEAYREKLLKEFGL